MSATPTHQVEQPNQEKASDEAANPVPCCNDNSNPQQGAIAKPAVNAPMDSTIEDPPKDPTTDNGHASVEAISEVQRTVTVPSSKKDARKLFVGGLPADITHEEFRFFFEQFGEVMDSVVMFDYETHRSRGFGFVTFRDPEDSRKMLMQGNDPNDHQEPKTGRMQMRNKLIEIKSAEPKEGRRGGRFHNNYRRHNHTSAVHKASVEQGIPYDQNMYYYGGPEAHAYPIYPPHYYAAGMVPAAGMFAGYMNSAYTPPQYAPAPGMYNSSSMYNGGMVPNNTPASMGMIPMHPGAVSYYPVIQHVAPGIPFKDEGDVIAIPPEMTNPAQPMNFA